MKILYIQHTWLPSGSAVSLLYTIQSIQASAPEKYQPLVALVRPTPEVEAMYRDAGIPVVNWPGIRSIEHTTGGWARITKPIELFRFIRSILGLPKTILSTRRLVQEISPDLVHLNSAVLLPCAIALKKAKVPVVWHVREVPARGYFGFRKAVFSYCMRRYPDELIFLSAWEKKSWVNNKRGKVVPNFIKKSAFSVGASKEEILKELHLHPSSNRILYVGGFSEIKGIETLVKALVLVRERIPGVMCLMPNTLASESDTGPIRSVLKKTLGRVRFQNRIMRFVKAHSLENNLVFLPFITPISKLIEIADFLVFPATKAHFSRPVMEASMLRKPSIASDLGGIREMMIDNQTGFLFEPENELELADRMIKLCNHPDLCEKMGNKAFEIVKDNFNTEKQINSILEIYKSLTPV